MGSFVGCDRHGTCARRVVVTFFSGFGGGAVGLCHPLFGGEWTRRKGVGTQGQLFRRFDPSRRGSEGWRNAVRIGSGRLN